MSSRSDTANNPGSSDRLKQSKSDVLSCKSALAATASSRRPSRGDALSQSRRTSYCDVQPYQQASAAAQDLPKRKQSLAAALEPERGFLDLIRELVEQHQRIQTQYKSVCAENRRLRSDLQALRSGAAPGSHEPETRPGSRERLGDAARSQSRKPTDNELVRRTSRRITSVLRGCVLPVTCTTSMSEDAPDGPLGRQISEESCRAAGPPGFKLAEAQGLSGFSPPAPSTPLSALTEGCRSPRSERASPRSPKRTFTNKLGPSMPHQGSRAKPESCLEGVTRMRDMRDLMNNAAADPPDSPLKPSLRQTYSNASDGSPILAVTNSADSRVIPLDGADSLRITPSRDGRPALPSKGSGSSRDPADLGDITVETTLMADYPMSEDTPAVPAAAAAANEPPAEQPNPSKESGDSQLDDHAAIYGKHESLFGTQMSAYQHEIQRAISDPDAAWHGSQADVFEPLQIWTRASKASGGSSSRKRSSTSPSTVGFSATMRSLSSRGLRDCRDCDSDFVEDLDLLSRCVVDGESRFAFSWDVWIGVMIVYDMIAIPLEAYDVLHHSFIRTHIEAVYAISWTFDIALNFFRGYESKGAVENRFDKIAHHYLQTWLFFDLVMLGVSWMRAAVLDQAKGPSWLLDIGGFARISLLLRLVKHAPSFFNTMNSIRSEDLLVFVRVVSLLLLITLMNHFISCAWYALGKLEQDERNWISQTFEEFDDFAYRYTTSFHWSITQFTPASMEVYPANAFERSFNICTILVGLIMFSSFVSNITNSMTYLTMRNYEKRQQNANLSSYLSHKGTHQRLKNEIMAAVSDKKKEKRQFRKEDFPVLDSLPKDLLQELNVTLYTAILDTHAFFNNLIKNEFAIANIICQHAMSEHTYLFGEDVFSFGKRSLSMYFVSRGKFTYVLGYGEEEPTKVAERQWLCEMPLWTKWTHRGRFSSSSESELAVLDSAEFGAIMLRSSNLREVQRYAHLYVELAEVDSGGAELITDLWGQRLRVMTLTQRAFNTDQPEFMDNLRGMLSGGAELNLSRWLMEWRKAAEREKRARRMGMRAFIMRASTVLGGLRRSSDDGTALQQTTSWRETAMRATSSWRSMLRAGRSSTRSKSRSRSRLF